MSQLGQEEIISKDVSTVASTRGCSISITKWTFFKGVCCDGMFSPTAGLVSVPRGVLNLDKAIGVIQVSSLIRLTDLEFLQSNRRQKCQYILTKPAGLDLVGSLSMSKLTSQDHQAIHPSGVLRASPGASEFQDNADLRRIATACRC